MCVRESWKEGDGDRERERKREGGGKREMSDGEE